jgi:8-oxo-dGTP pyrophosphatase MutT (NUDIX family)
VTWRAGAYVLAEREGRVLMLKSLQSGRWELPGGGVELHETLQQGAARECYEETGYRVTWSESQPLHVGEQLFCWQGDVMHYWHAVSVIFRATVGRGAEGAWTPDPLEVAEVRWMLPGHLTAQNTQPF